MSQSTDLVAQHPSVRQGGTLLALGIICALIAALAAPGHEVGLLALGVGLLIAHLADRRHLFHGGVLVTPFALVNVLLSLGVISGNALFGAYVLAAAVGVGVSTLAARRGYTSVQPWSPVVLLAVIGFLLLGTVLRGGLAAAFYALFVSFWLPAVVLGGMGVVLLARDLVQRRVRG